MNHSIYTLLIFLLLSKVVIINAQIPGLNYHSVISTENFTGTLEDSTHECRLWGMLTSGNFNDSSKINHLRNFRLLASSNPNGWGCGFYTRTIKGGLIPVIYRGMWRADEDFLYDSSARIMVENLSTCGIAHVRNSSSGYVNIPNPHPFYTKSLSRDFSMLFAHNGTLNKPTLKTLLSDYTVTNHYSYSTSSSVDDPNHDSDLYRLYLMKWIDEHPFSHITICLKDALIALTSEMGTSLSYNFIMTSTWDTLWALRYNNSLSYRRDTEALGVYTWEIASEPLSEEGWITASDHFLYVFSTSRPTPDSIPIKDEEYGLPENMVTDIPISFMFPNPSSGSSLDLEINSIGNQRAYFQLIDPQGQIISRWPEIYLVSGINHVSFDITGLKAGMYYIRLATGNYSQTKKLIVVR